jgi:DNA-binding protein H-NS
MDLNNLSLDELKTLQNDVAVAIFNFEKRKKAEALAEVERVAKANGFSLKELLGDEKTASKKSKVAAKYANPANPEQTWSGRGRKPAWVNEFEASGNSLENAKI